MSRLIWNKTGERFYEAGVSNTVIYKQGANGTYPAGAAWNGVTAINESPSGAEPTPLYADNIKYLTLMSAEEFGFTIEAYTYPDEFAECNGEASLADGVNVGQQTRKAFGLSYKTMIGNDVDGESHGYNLHLIYGALAAPSEKGHATINEDPEAATMSWECTTTPIQTTGFKPVSHITISSKTADPTKLKALETILYGKDATTEPQADAVVARLPLPDEIATLMAKA